MAAYSTPSSEAALLHRLPEARTGRGGPRPGAGRPSGPRPRVPHRRRETLTGSCPLHVTVRVRPDVPSLRTVAVVRAFRRSLARGSERGDFRVAHYALQGDHAHLIVEASSKRALAKRDEQHRGEARAGGEPGGGPARPGAGRPLPPARARHAARGEAGARVRPHQCAPPPPEEPSQHDRREPGSLRSGAGSTGGGRRPPPARPRFAVAQKSLANGLGCSGSAGAVTGSSIRRPDESRARDPSPPPKPYPTRLG